MIKSLRSTMNRHLAALACTGMLCIAGGTAVAAQATLDGQTVKTPRHTIQLAPTGLPENVEINAHEQEIPLTERDDDLSQAALNAIGRGIQLTDVRLTAQIGESTVVAEPENAMKAERKGDAVQVTSRLKAGDVAFDADLQYTGDGAMFATLTYSGNNVEVQAVSLQMTLPGEIDFVLPVSPSDERLLETDGKQFIPENVPQGTIWQNAGEFAEDRSIVSPGLLEHVFVGNGDRGFTWLTSGDGFDLTDEDPFCELARNEDGDIVWTLNLVNHAVTLKGKAKAEFAILTHPAKPYADMSKSELWFKTPATVDTPEASTISLDDRQSAGSEGDSVVRADSATVYESTARLNVLAGPAGGDAESADKNISDAYTMPLFRYYAGTHTALPAVLRSNSGELIRAGNTPKPDRMVLGRALLHGISADIAKLAHVVSAGKLMKAIEEFGFFEDDGNTEFIPYWRSGEHVRYGEEFMGGEFSVTQENPLAEAYATIYRRPVAEQADRYKAMIVVVNETDENQYAQFYLQDADRLLGGANSLTYWPEMTKTYWQDDLIPSNSDWRKNNVRNYVVGRGKTLESMIDMEGEGQVRQASKDGSLEIYGPLFIPAHDFRVVKISGE
ncbi:MAG: hypothetical protein ACOCWJ_06550 [Verrucomicrobiota bacterium]